MSLNDAEHTDMAEKSKHLARSAERSNKKSDRQGRRDEDTRTRPKWVWQSPECWLWRFGPIPSNGQSAIAPTWAFIQHKSLSCSFSHYISVLSLTKKYHMPRQNDSWEAETTKKCGNRLWARETLHTALMVSKRVSFEKPVQWKKADRKNFLLFS